MKTESFVFKNGWRMPNHCSSQPRYQSTNNGGCVTFRRDKISQAMPAESKAVKATIAKTAEALGIATDLYKTVKKLT